MRTGGSTLADRATIANMSPEFGSTCAIFPIDQETLRYLELSGRSQDHIELVGAYAKAQGLWRADGQPAARAEPGLQGGEVEGHARRRAMEGGPGSGPAGTCRILRNRARGLSPISGALSAHLRASAVAAAPGGGVWTAAVTDSTAPAGRPRRRRVGAGGRDRDGRAPGMAPMAVPLHSCGARVATSVAPTRAALPEVAA